MNRYLLHNVKYNSKTSKLRHRFRTSIKIIFELSESLQKIYTQKFHLVSDIPYFQWKFQSSTARFHVAAAENTLGSTSVIRGAFAENGEILEECRSLFGLRSIWAATLTEERRACCTNARSFIPHNRRTVARCGHWKWCESVYRVHSVCSISKWLGVVLWFGCQSCSVRRFYRKLCKLNQCVNACALIIRFEY